MSVGIPAVGIEDLQSLQIRFELRAIEVMRGAPWQPAARLCRENRLQSRGRERVVAVKHKRCNFDIALLMAGGDEERQQGGDEHAPCYSRPTSHRRPLVGSGRIDLTSLKVQCSYPDIYSTRRRRFRASGGY